MSHGRRIGLDNPAFGGRVRSHGSPAGFVRRPIQPQVRRSVDGIVQPAAPVATPTIEAKKVHRKTSRSPGTHTAVPVLPRQSRSVVLARQMVRKKPKKRLPHVTEKSRVSALLVVMAAVIFAGGSLVSYLSWSTNRKAAAQVEVLAQSTDEEEKGNVITEDDITPEIIGLYQVAPDLPRLLKIPRLQVAARVKRLSALPSGKLPAPNNINDAGWYDSSAKPGENGAVVIDGRVHGPTKPGVFYRLGNLRQGDTVEIERGDGKIISYKVIKTETVGYNKIDMAKTLTSIELGKPGLNLISYSDRYDTRTNEYEQHLVVYTVQN